MFPIFLPKRKTFQENDLGATITTFCDIHNHLLPGVDDGSCSMTETLSHLQDFRAQGVTEIVLTPHLLAAELEPFQIGAWVQVNGGSLRGLYTGDALMSSGPCQALGIRGRSPTRDRDPVEAPAGTAA